MTSPRQFGSGSNPLPSADETLRLIANLPAPEGLTGRVQAKLQEAPRSTGRWKWRWESVLHPWMHSQSLRGAAAAAIVCVVAGGGWGIYSHVQPATSARVLIVPVRPSASGGFSNAGAMRQPDTLNGPVLTHSVAPAPADEKAIVSGETSSTVQMEKGHPKKAKSSKGQPGDRRSMKPGSALPDEGAEDHSQ